MGLRDFFNGLKKNSNIDGSSSPAPLPVEPSLVPRLTPLCAACKEGDFETAVALLKGGADPNEASYDGRTPLFYCSEAALVGLLVHFGADVNATDEAGNTPLMEILRGENVNSNGERAVIVLIESGADTEAKNSDGLSARDIAASRKGSLSDFDQYMLDQGFAIETDSHDEMYAAFEQGLRVIGNRKRAFEAKTSQQRARRESWHAEMNPIADNSPRNVVTNCFLACNMNDIEVLKAHEDEVRSHIATTIGGGNMNVQTMLMMACVDASAEVVEYLIELGSDVNQLDDTGQAPLRYAAVSWIDAEKKIELLLAAGADINHRSYDGSTALSDAAYRQNVPAAKALIAHGADVSNRDAQGFSALSWTCGQGVPEADIVELLLRYGADVGDLYERGCALQYIDYGDNHTYQQPREVVLRPQDLKERYLYEHALIPILPTRSGRERLRAQGFGY
jgi:ankyrin repeat protein